MNEVERAAQVTQRCVDHMFSLKGKTLAVAVAEALSEAGWLRTDADKLNAELAELVVRYVETAYPKPILATSPSWRPVVEAAHAILDARKPSPRWAVGNGGAGMLYTVFEVGHPTDGIVGYFPSKSAATDYAARLNAEGAK